MLLGVDQGAAILAGVANVRVVEAALASKCVNAVDALEVARAWADVRVGVLQSPWILKCDVKLPLLEQAVPEFERTMIEVALQHTGGRKRDAAALLGWGRNTLTRKIKELDMEAEFSGDD